jgi:electron transfer flavoprotein beta subunit
LNIIVLIKQVPNTTRVKLDKKTGNLIREGVEAVMNPEDRHALEAAVRIKEGAAEATVTALTMGPPQAVDVLTEALGMGADKGVLLTDRLFAGADTWATSTVLAKAVEHLGGGDLILAGRQAIDGDTAQIGPQVAEALGYSQATYVQGIEMDGGKLTVQRKLDQGVEELELQLPALLTVLADLNKPRHPGVLGLLGACLNKAPIRVLNTADLGLTLDEVGLPGSLTQVVKTFSPKQGRETVILEGSPTEMAGKLIQSLVEAKVVTRSGANTEGGA